MLLNDLRYGLRQLRQNPGLTAVVVLTIALGIGANTAMFSVINGFIRPLPVAAPDQLVVVGAQSKSDEYGIEYKVSHAALVDLRAQAETFSDLLGYNLGLEGLTSNGRTEPFMLSYVTGNYFSALGIQPAAGRLFTAGEGEAPGVDPIVVLGYHCWQKRFGGDPAVVGTRVRINGKTATIVGVAAAGFTGVFSAAEMDGYLPLNHLTVNREMRGLDLFGNRRVRPLTVLGRLKSGVTVAEAQSALDVVAARLAAEYPTSDNDLGYRILPERFARPFPMPRVARVIPGIAGLFLVLAGLVLLLACMNVANILLVRASARQREIAVRAALGSGRARLVRQLLTDSLLLAAFGGLAGVLLGIWVSHALSGIRLESNYPALRAGFDWRVFAYALAATAFTGVAAGVWPAVRGSRADINAVLGGRSDSAAPDRQRVRGALVLAQLAGSLVLLVIAGLFVRNLEGAQQLNLGFDPDNVLNAATNTDYVGYDVEKSRTFYRELLRRVRAFPEVESASLAYSVPMGYWDAGSGLYFEDRPLPPGERAPGSLFNAVSPGYFETMRVSLRRGRAFLESDTETAPRVAIVNQTFASRFWPGQDPIGKRFSMRRGEAPWEVVGVAGDGKYWVVFEPQLAYFFVPLQQLHTARRVLQVRSPLRPETLGPRIEREIRALDADMPVSDLQSMRQSLGGGMGFLMFRVGASIAAAMGLLGLALAAVGVYGVVSFGASQRTKEIGIRVALGATRGSVLRLILRQAVTVIVAGVAAGLVLTFAVVRLVGRILAFVNAVDAVTFAGVTLLLAAIALVACYVPARRAMRVDAMVALRRE